MTVAAGATTRQKQPAALYVLFMTELWERFGYYSLVSIFALYLVNELKLPDTQAFLIFGAYTSFAYLTTVAGGIAADRVLGFGRAIVVGALVVGIGYLVLGFGGEPLMFLALGLMACGNGLFKPNVSALLGRFYGEEDPRRASGFTIFYMGINIGALAGSLLAGIIADTVSYTAAFAVAGGGKMISLVTYMIGKRWIGRHDAPPKISQPARWNGIVALTVAVAVGLSAILLSHPEWAGWFVFAVGMVLLGSYLAVMAKQPEEYRNRLALLLLLIVFSIPFWAVYQQYALSVTLFTERDVDRNIFGWIMPASEGTAMSAAFLILLSPVVAWVWLRLARGGVSVSDIVKYGLGLVWMGLAYLFLALGVFETSDGVKASLLWVLAFYVIFELGEICLSPLGLALTTKLAPRQLGGFAMGVWFYASAAANFVAGLIGGFAAVPKGATAAQETAIYEQGFFIYGMIALGTALVMLLALPWLKRLAGSNLGSSA